MMFLHIWSETSVYFKNLTHLLKENAKFSLCSLLVIAKINNDISLHITL